MSSDADDSDEGYGAPRRTSRGASRAGKRPAVRRERPPPRPITPAQLSDMALAYAARYATTGAKLIRYLTRKLRERGWAGDDPPDVADLAARLVGHGYVNDRVYAEAKARGMAARGLGARRVRGALSAAGVSAGDQDAALEGGADALGIAIAFARRRRFGPFAREGTAAPDPARRQKEMAAMLRAGHAMDVARKVLNARDAETAEALEE